MKLTVRYDAAEMKTADIQRLDDDLTAVALQNGYMFIASGYNVESGERDVRFERGNGE